MDGFIITYALSNMAHACLQVGMGGWVTFLYALKQIGW